MASTRKSDPCPSAPLQFLTPYVSSLDSPFNNLNTSDVIINM